MRTIFCFLFLTSITFGQEDIQEELAQQAKRILMENCYSCHGVDREGDPNFDVSDYKYLLTGAKTPLIAPGDLSRSRIIERIEDGDMPPQGDPVTPGDFAILKRWVELGAPTWKEIQHREFVGRDYVLRTISLDRQIYGLGTNYKYFSIAHLYNMGLSDDVLEDHRQALNNTCNMLSFGMETPVMWVDKKRLIGRIGISDYLWSELKWQAVLRFYGYPDKEIFLRGDAFVWLVLQPALYNFMLDIPLRERDFEQKMGVDRNPFNAVFAGGESNASNFNRVFMRRQGTHGYVWTALSFLNENTANKRISSFPNIAPDYNLYVARLPNMRPMFAIYNTEQNRNNGERRNQVQPEAETDPHKVNGSSTVQIVTACINCHKQAVMPNIVDVFRNGTQFNPQTTVAGIPIYQFIQMRVPTQEQLDQILKEDRESYTRFHGTKEPIGGVVKRYLRPLSLEMAATESEMTTEGLGLLIQTNPLLQRSGLVPLVHNRKIRRDAWHSGQAIRVTATVRGEVVPQVVQQQIQQAIPITSLIQQQRQSGTRIAANGEILVNNNRFNEE